MVPFDRIQSSKHKNRACRHGGYNQPGTFIFSQVIATLLKIEKT